MAQPLLPSIFRKSRSPNAPALAVEGGFKAPAGMPPSVLPTLHDLGLPHPTQAQPPAGEDAAHAVLHSFLAGADLSQLKLLAYQEGMQPLMLNGAEKVAAGITTIEELLKVAPPLDQ